MSKTNKITFIDTQDTINIIPTTPQTYVEWCKLHPELNRCPICDAEQRLGKQSTREQLNWPYEANNKA